ncbi:MAG TPA: imelysin family protein [Saprospiraceae bacterium]|nr:imelysin family protein [Saprospiraceae bacterium]
MRKSFFIFISLLTVAVFTSCKDEPVNPEKNYTAQLENIGNDVILKTYEELFIKTQALANTLAGLESNPTSQALDASRQAWRDSRVPWEQSEGFLFGPVDQQGIDPAIDSWPVNETDLDAVLNGPQPLTKTYIDGLDGTLKGFHTIEYLLFGVDGNKFVGDFTARQFEYLSACSESLLGSTQQLYDSWKPTGGNFIQNITQAGKAGLSIYPSQKSALQEIMNGMITIADEVANGKINDPFTQQNVTLEESRFSANSKQDFADNIRSIKNAYTGNYFNTDGTGISQIIREKNPTLDTSVKQQIDDAIAAILAIQGTFTSAIFNAPQSVQDAQTKVRDLQQTLEGEVLPVITSL